MVKVGVWCIHQEQPLSASIQKELAAALPDHIMGGLSRVSRWQEVRNRLLGKTLLRLFLNETYGSRFDLSMLKFQKRGKPYFSGDPFFFNISHAGDLIVLAHCSESDIGVDVENVIPVDINRYQKQFSEAEMEKLIKSQDPQQSFYHYWTKKEAISKAIGHGVSRPFREIVIDDQGTSKYYQKSWNFGSIDNFPGYVGYTASEIAHEVDVQTFHLVDTHPYLVKSA